MDFVNPHAIVLDRTTFDKIEDLGILIRKDLEDHYFEALATGDTFYVKGWRDAGHGLPRAIVYTKAEFVAEHPDVDLTTLTKDWKRI